MILQFIFAIFIALIETILNLLPDISITIPDLSLFNDWLNNLAYMFPSGLLATAFASVVSWHTLHLGYSPLQWIYHKIRG